MTLIGKREGLRTEWGTEWIFSFVEIQACGQWCIFVKSSIWENNGGRTYTDNMCSYLAWRGMCRKKKRSTAFKNSSVLLAVLSGAIWWYLTKYRKKKYMKMNDFHELCVIPKCLYVLVCACAW